MIAEVAPHVASDAASALTARLLARLRIFASDAGGLQANVVRPAINALVELTAARTKAQSFDATAAACAQWMKTLMRGAVERLKKYSLTPAAINEPQALVCLYTVGELCMAAMGDPKLDATPEGSGAESGASANVRREGGAALHTSAHRAIFGKSVVAVVQALTARSTTNADVRCSFLFVYFGASSFAHLYLHTHFLVCSSASPQVATPVSVRAHAFLTLGKLCLHDASLAQLCVAVLVRELTPGAEGEADVDAVVRSNVLVVLGDLCKQHTGVVERYVPDVARCLQDRSHIVRENALLVISSLLLEGFIRLRGPVFFRMLASFALESHPADAERISAPSAQAHARMANNVRHTIFEIFARRDQALLPSHFVEAMFVFNDCADHPAYRRWVEEGMGAGAAPVASEGADATAALAGAYSSEASRAAANDAKAVFSLAGGDALSMTRRRTVYAAMLASMGAEGKLRVTARIGREVLAAALEGSVRIDATLGGTATPSSQLLLDAFDVLCCEDIKVKVGASISAGAEYDADAASQLNEDDAAAGAKPVQAAIASARTRLLSRMNRKAVLEHVVPVLIALKQKLEASNSPLVGSLMRYLKQLFLEKETRSQVLDVLADSRTLANEILYDLRMFDEREEEAAAAEGEEEAAGAGSAAEGPSSRPMGSRSRGASAMAPPMSTSAARLTTTPAPTPLVVGTGSGKASRSRSRSRGSVGGSGRTPAQRRGRSRRVGAGAGTSPMVPLSLDKSARENASNDNAARDAATPMSASPKLRAPRRTRGVRAAP